MESHKIRDELTAGEIFDMSFGSSNRPDELEVGISGITKKGIVEKFSSVNLKARLLLRGFSRRNSSPEKQQPKT